MTATEAPRRPFTGVHWRDVALAVFVLVLSEQEVWSPVAGFSESQGPRGVVAVSYLIASLALMWRRVAPLAVLTVVTVVQGTEFLLFGAPQGLGTFLPVLFAFFAVGRYCDTLRFLIGLLLTVLFGAIHETQDPKFVFDGVAVTFWLIGLGSGFLGLILRERAAEVADAQADAGRARAEALAREEAAAAEERQRIAAELHDIVGHGLSLMVLQLVAAQETLDAGEVDATRDRLAGLEGTARSTLVELRRLVDVTDDEAPLAPQPGLDDVPALVSEVASAGVPVRYTPTGEDLAVSAGMGLAVYRIVQESLTNVLKHGDPPGPTTVTVDRSRDWLSVEVEDRSPARSGPPDAGANAGRGLTGMRQRVQLFGGTLDAGPQPEGGFRVLARFPLPEATA